MSQSNRAHFEKRIPVILELGFNKAALPKLKDFIDFLWESNEILNLISRKMTFEELIDNHLIDCLLPLKFFPDNLANVADFGTGGGLPGVIYALQFPTTRFHLFEKSNLKRDFLGRCLRFTSNLDFHSEIPRQLENIDLVMARAFKPIDVILDMSRSYYENGGKYFLYKARLEKIEEELLLAKKQFKDLEVKIEPIQSPVLEVERHLVLI
jgi:16S rRNA (guanine527-N7)-methyltransferase